MQIFHLCVIRDTKFVPLRRLCVASGGSLPALEGLVDLISPNLDDPK